MKINWPTPGKYIVAVSGGVDSVVLLHMLVEHGGYDLVVAHIDHGVRPDSAADLELVRQLAAQYGLDFVYTMYNFTTETSEAAMRQARYKFLFDAMKDQEAIAIITAHHADDLLETSIMNVRRGTDRYGAAGGMSREGTYRPLLRVRKKELLNYAEEHKLQWREDSTNQDVKYTRNLVRHQVIPNIDTVEYQKHLDELGQLNQKIDSLLAGKVSIKKGTITLKRSVLNGLSLRELEVLLAYALRQLDLNIELSRPQIARLAREILLAGHKNSFTLPGQTGILIKVQ